MQASAPRILLSVVTQLEHGQSVAWIDFSYSAENLRCSETVGNGSQHFSKLGLQKYTHLTYLGDGQKRLWRVSRETVSNDFILVLSTSLEHHMYHRRVRDTTTYCNLFRYTGSLDNMKQPQAQSNRCTSSTKHAGHWINEVSMEEQYPNRQSWSSPEVAVEHLWTICHDEPFPI
ncbi:hypothetical protein N657DRAFT_630954 [Parathielavia appendiculata]|uniref:Uncharacterized protein n=1 Tax=Parathielavia appendiculata TaxID=2587402 RepID=A0AAN6Z6P2_9PEZI|nr:hypothetical protein N657DRAFT_630954 [Parathielavia appendiculata]